MIKDKIIEYCNFLGLDTIGFIPCRNFEEMVEFYKYRKEGVIMERLQKLIAEAGYCSRRKAEELIKQGKVKLNGKTITELGTKASFGDEILVEGNLIEYQEKEYYLFLRLFII